MILPLWLVIASSALYLVPGLGGDWMLDPATGDITFVYHSMFSLIFWGGLAGALVLAMGTPLIALGFLFTSGLQVLGRRRDRADAQTFAQQPAVLELDIELVVRKRGRSGRTANAIAITLGAASPLRRLLARTFDVGLLAATVIGAAIFAVLIDTTGVGWIGLTLQRPLIYGAIAGGLLYLVQWLAVYDRGQTLGKILFDVRLADRAEQGRPGVLRGVVLRHVLFDIGDVFVAAGLAFVASELATQLLSESTLAPLFELFVVREIGYFAFWPLMVFALGALRSVPLLFGLPWALHDLVGRTWVVRTSVGDEGTGDVPLGYRLVARAIDLSLFMGIGGWPLMLGWMLLDSDDNPVRGLLLLMLGSIPALAVLSALWGQLLYRGATPGKQLLGIEVVPLQGERSFVTVIVIREWLALFGLALALPGVGTLLDASAALSDDRRAIHDHLAGTRVVWKGTTA